MIHFGKAALLGILRFCGFTLTMPIVIPAFILDIGGDERLLNWTYDHWPWTWLFPD
jgi:hypothetical protein